MTLVITRDDLRIAVGEFLGYGRNPFIWKTDEIERVDRIIESGERNFYLPSVLPNEKLPHVWSFLTPILRIGITSGVTDYELPADFGSGFLDPTLSFSQDDNAWSHVTLTGVGQILRRRGESLLQTASHPTLAAVNILPSDGSRAQVHTLMVWPEPTSSGTLRGQYYANPHGVASTTPYPLGGQPHGETLREAVLAAAEWEVNKKAGPHHEKFMERLMASVALDRKLTVPRFFGSMNRSCRVPNERRSSEFVSYNGEFFLGAD